MRNKKLVKVIFEFDDDTCDVLKDRPDEWLKRINGLCAFAENHRCNPDWANYKWERNIKNGV